MNMDQRIARINELYHKSQGQGLTKEEKEEQAQLRREYVASVRNNLKAQLDNISVENADGSIVNLKDRAKKAESKAALRRQILNKRDLLNEYERKKASVLLTERILGHQWYYLAKNILVFVSYGSEIDTSEIIKDALRKRKKVFVPRVVGEDMVFYRIYDMDELKEGYKGIPEPSLSEEPFCYQEELAEDTLMIMPGVVFDRKRNRIGYGKGFYDRYLADKTALQNKTIAVGYQCQMLEEIPAEETDIRPCQIICT